MNKEDLLKLIADDNLGLLKVKPKQNSLDENQRLINSFLEINEFIRKNNREPSANGDIFEHKLYSRLNSLASDKDKISILVDYDEFGLLKEKEEKAPKSIKDLLKDDDLGILISEEEDIFINKHVPKITSMPDYVAKRKPCKDFDKFEEKFKNCQNDLASQKRILKKFQKEQQIEEGSFFVLKGILLFVDKVGEKQEVKGKVNARLRCIFENGTESNMLLRSLAAELYKDGRRVTENKDNLSDLFVQVTKEDQETGFIYILKSLSDNEKIRSIDNLYKIGFSKTPVEERIKNAKNDPTYLMSDVQIVATFKCFNLNPQKLESLLHTFFGSACLNIDIFDNNKKRHTPREWFIAPFFVVENAIELIIAGKITNYRYDPENEVIIKK
ncbi:GIY-YIG nuclease family protein [Rickettsiales bacterium]|nr:GIY-YIG nuclease family protein [Rickettsiales bacterium]